MISEKISQYWRVSVVEVTGSTQDDLTQLVADKKASNGDVIATEFQSAGRGRLDRKFDAPASSALLFSFYIEPKREKSDWSFLPLLTGLSAIFALTPFPVSGKVRVRSASTGSVNFRPNEPATSRAIPRMLSA